MSKATQLVSELGLAPNRLISSHGLFSLCTFVRVPGYEQILRTKEEVGGHTMSINSFRVSAKGKVDG